MIKKYYNMYFQYLKLVKCYECLLKLVKYCIRLLELQKQSCRFGQ